MKPENELNALFVEIISDHFGKVPSSLVSVFLENNFKNETFTLKELFSKVEKNEKPAGCPNLTFTLETSGEVAPKNQKDLGVSWTKIRDSLVLLILHNVIECVKNENQDFEFKLNFFEILARTKYPTFVEIACKNVDDGKNTLETSMEL